MVLGRHGGLQLKLLDPEQRFDNKATVDLTTEALRTRRTAIEESEKAAREAAAAATKQMQDALAKVARMEADALRAHSAHDDTIALLREELAAAKAAVRHARGLSRSVAALGLR